MRGVRIAPVHVLTRDPDVLERRARALAAGGAGAEEERPADLVLVAFRLGSLPCAVETRIVQRVVARLGGAILVPRADGGERLVSFVEERPVAVADLVSLGCDGPRAPAGIADSPALLVDAGGALVAVAVDGPLELVEERVAHLSPVDPETDTARPRMAGALANGTSVFDPDWLTGWAVRMTI